MFEFNPRFHFSVLINFSPFNVRLSLPWLFIFQLFKPTMTLEQLTQTPGLGFDFIDRFIHLKFFSYNHYFDIREWFETLLYGKETVEDILDPVDKRVEYEVVSKRGNTWFVQSGKRIIRNSRLKEYDELPVWSIQLTVNKTGLPYDQLSCSLQKSPADLIELSEDFSEAMKKEVEKLQSSV